MSKQSLYGVFVESAEICLDNADKADVYAERGNHLAEAQVWALLAIAAAITEEAE